jgi:hypothetical protein
MRILSSGWRGRVYLAGLHLSVLFFFTITIIDIDIDIDINIFFFFTL